MSASSSIHPIQNSRLGRIASTETIPAAQGTGLFLLALSILLLTSLPDGMAVPVLKELIVSRYGVTEAAAHHFMSINLLGGLLAFPLLARLRRKFSPASILLVSALADACLLLLLVAPIGYAATLVVRVAEGGADLLVFATLFDLMGKAGSIRHRGRRLGIASSVLLLGLSLGIATGGWIGAHTPQWIFVAGAAANIAAVCILRASARSMNDMIRSCPAIEILGDRFKSTRGTIWPAMCMSFGDRAIAGLMVTSLPLYFSSVCGFTPGQRGLLIAPSLAIMALGAIPAGALADRIGAVRLRMISALGYAISFLLLTVFPPLGFMPTLLVTCSIGIFGAGMLPTSLVIATSAGLGSVGMAMHRASGDLGYLTGIVTASFVMFTFPSSPGDTSVVVLLICGFALLHLLLTLVAGFRLVGVFRSNFDTI